MSEESHLRAADRKLAAHVERLEALIASRKESQTSVDFLLAIAKRPRESTKALSAREEELKTVKAARAVAADIAKELRTDIEKQTEDHVRETDEAYVRGLAAFENTEDWERAIDRFEASLALFLRKLGEARNMTCANYDRVNLRISQAGEDAIVAAIEAASILENEIMFVNQVINAHAELLDGTPVAQAELERIPIGQYCDWTRKLRDLPIGEMQAEFEHIIGHCENLSHSGIPTLRAAIGTAKSRSFELSRGYVLGYIDTLRDFSDQHWFDAHETERFIEGIEKRYGKKINKKKDEPAAPEAPEELDPEAYVQGGEQEQGETQAEPTEEPPAQ